MATKLDIDRSALLRRAVARGAKSVLVDEAVSQYLKGSLSGGAAAEWAGVSLLEFMDELHHRRLPYLVDNEGIAEELVTLDPPRKARGRRHR